MRPINLIEKRPTHPEDPAGRDVASWAMVARVPHAVTAGHAFVAVQKKKNAFHYYYYANSLNIFKNLIYTALIITFIPSLRQQDLILIHLF